MLGDRLYLLYRDYYWICPFMLDSPSMLAFFLMEYILHGRMINMTRIVYLHHLGKLAGRD